MTCPVCNGTHKDPRGGGCFNCGGTGKVASAATTLLTYTGPTKINCPESCDVPEGVTLTLVPAPRHAWPDVAICPNDGCGYAFLIEAKS